MIFGHDGHDEGGTVLTVSHDAVLVLAMIVTLLIFSAGIMLGIPAGRGLEAQLALDAFDREAYAWDVLEQSVVAGKAALRICVESDAKLLLELGRYPAPLPAPPGVRITAAGGK